MTAEELITAFETVAEAPDAVSRLRELVLHLAVRGKLVPQDPGDEPADVLLERIAEAKARSANGGKRRHNVSFDLPFALPQGWSWARFGDTHINRDAERVPVSREERAQRQGEYDYYGASGVIDKIDDYLFDKPLLLIGEDGANLVLRSTPIAFMARGKYWVNNHAHVLDSLDELSLRYLAVFVNATDLKPYLTGTAQPKLNQAKMNSIPCPFPPLAEQHRIVARVDELMGLLDRLEAVRKDRDAARTAARDSALQALRDAASPEEVETAWNRVASRIDDLFTCPADMDPLRQTVLQLAVRGMLVPQDPKDAPAPMVLGLIAQERAALLAEGKIRQRQAPPPVDSSALPPLPPSWTWARLGDVLFDIEAGWSPSALNRPSEDGEWGVLKVSACSWGRFQPQENKALAPGTEPRPQLEVKGGDFLISRANTLELVARSVVVDECPPCLMLSDKTLRLDLARQCVTRFVNLANLAPIAREHYERNASGTSASMRNVSQQAIWEAPIPVPPVPEQHRIVAKVEELAILLGHLEDRLREVQETQAAFAAAAVHHLDT